MERCERCPAPAVPRGTALSSSSATSRSLLEILAAGLAELGLPEESSQALVPRLAELAVLVWRWSRRTNLTAHRSPEAISRRLILDAVALGQVLPEADSIADLGAGAGFPGLPLALLNPSASVTLVEARLRRHHFQRAAARELAIANATPIHGRAEQIEASPHRLVLAQAVARPSTVLAWMLRWTEPGGFLALPCGQEPPAIAPPPGVIPSTPLRYTVPLRGPARSVWLGVRARSTNPGLVPDGCGT